MIKLLALALALAGVGWYYFVDGRRLDESMVREYYVGVQHATLSRNPEAQCKLIGKSAVLRQQTLMAGQTKSETLDRQKACEQLHKTAKFFEEVGDKAGGMLTIEYDYEIGRIELAPDRQSATVEINSTLKMGEAFMRLRTTSVDRLVRRWGNIELAGADAKTQVSWTPGALTDPTRYFQAQ